MFNWSETESDILASGFEMLCDMVPYVCMTLHVELPGDYSFKWDAFPNDMSVVIFDNSHPEIDLWLYVADYIDAVPEPTCESECKGMSAPVLGCAGVSGNYDAVTGVALGDWDGERLACEYLPGVADCLASQITESLSFLGVGGEA